MIAPTLCALGGAAALGLGAIARGAFAPRSQFFGPVLWHGPRDVARPDDPPAIALSFDDGPDPADTPRVLDILDRYRVPAAFFMVGKLIDQHPGLARQTQDRGHLIANHSYDHHRGGMFRSRAYWLDQLTRTNDAIARVTGQTPTLFRPPMGFKQPRIMGAARRLDLTVVTWTARALDGRPTTAEQILTRLGGPRRGGDILALHAGPEPNRPRDPTATLDALPRLIDTLRSRGLKLDRLDHVLRLPGYRQEPARGQHIPA